MFFSQTHWEYCFWYYFYYPSPPTPRLTSTEIYSPTNGFISFKIQHMQTKLTEKYAKCIKYTISGVHFNLYSMWFAKIFCLSEYWRFLSTWNRSTFAFQLANFSNFFHSTHCRSSSALDIGSQIEEILYVASPSFYTTRVSSLLLFPTFSHFSYFFLLLIESPTFSYFWGFLQVLK